MVHIRYNNLLNRPLYAYDVRKKSVFEKGQQPACLTSCLFYFASILNCTKLIFSFRFVSRQFFPISNSNFNLIKMSRLNKQTN